MSMVQILFKNPIMAEVHTEEREKMGGTIPGT